MLSSCRGLLILARMPYYAVAIGRKAGIFGTWAECELQVKGYPGARFKKFKSESECRTFISLVGVTSKDAVKIEEKPTFSRPEPPPPPPGRKRNATASTKIELNDDGTSRVLSDAPPRRIDSIDLSALDDDDEDVDRSLVALVDDLENAAPSRVKRKQTILLDSPVERKKAKVERRGDSTYELDDEGYVVAYTDGSCTRNGTAYARAGLGVYFGEQHRLNASEPVAGRATNNCGEIQAATKAILAAHGAGIEKLAVHTDSQFVINAATKWMQGWKRKGWKLASGDPVKNEADFKELDKALKLMRVKFVYVEAHRGILGNERADQFAKVGAMLYKNKLI